MVRIMRLLLVTLFCCLALPVLHAQRVEPAVAGNSPRRTFLMDEGWKFYRGSLDQPLPRGHHWIYKSVKAGAARGPAAFQYDDGSWRTVDLPHDYVVEGAFVNKPELVSHGFLERPEGWYRRRFLLPAEARGKSVWLYFDGVFGQSQVWVNGQELRKNDNGYIGFRVDISDVAHYGDRPNVVAVRCDPREAQGWWYEGGGIYRHVWLTMAEPVHIAPYGVYISADKKKGGKWLASVETAVENEGKDDARVKIVVTLVDSRGKAIATAVREAEAPGGETTRVRQNIAVPENRVKPWSVDSPNLYGIRAELFVDNKKTDATGELFGFRTLEFDAQQGFLLNGVPLKLKGVCMHQDHAGVGVALPDAIQDFRIARLKQFGCNAYRCSHNPPTPELLRACDRLGMLVLNENRFFNSSEDSLRQLEEQVRRDRNHPSVMMWSTFNEEDWQGDERGVKIVERMKRSILREDFLARRPVTGAMSAGFSKEGAFGPLDVLGVNYALGVHDHVHTKLYPDKMIYSSEAVSHSASRGEWQDKKNVFNNYDNHWVGWGSSIRNAWKHIDRRPWDAGIFIWTGFDYRGEPTPTNDWPVVSSYFGIVDTCGFAKDSFYLLQALWTKEPMAHVFPHWNLGPGMAGKTVKVGVYTNGDEAELIQNGTSLGKKPVDKYEQLFWDVVYQPGELKLNAYKQGRLWAQDKVVTTGDAQALGVETRWGDWERKDIKTGVSDAVPVAVYAVDDRGRRVPTASNKVRFDVSGGKVLGVGNGDPLCHEADIARERSLYNGLACAIIAASPGAKELVVTVSSPGLKPATLKLPVIQGRGFAQYPQADGGQVITDWRMSAVTDAPQDPNRPIADGDMNTWQAVAVGDGPQPQWEQKQGWATYRALFDMPGKGETWTLTLNGVAGKAEIYVNGRKVSAKNAAAPGTMTAPVQAPPGSKVTVSVQVQGANARSGLTGTARLAPPGK